MSWWVAVWVGELVCGLVGELVCGLVGELVCGSVCWWVGQ